MVVWCGMLITAQGDVGVYRVMPSRFLCLSLAQLYQ